MKKKLLTSVITGLFMFCWLDVAKATIIAHYDFNEGSGSTLSDDSGFGNNGAISGATWTTGLNGSAALLFDGVDDYVEVPNSSSIAINSYGFTIESWINPQSTSYPNIIVSAYYGDGYYLRVEGDGVGFFGEGSLQTSQGFISLNSWSHVVGTFDGTYASIYVNGQLAAHDQTVWPGPGMVLTGYPLRIGAAPISGSSPFNGLIDEVTIYNNSLSAGDVLQRYQEYAGSSPVPEPTTILLFVTGIAGIIGTRLRKKK